MICSACTSFLFFSFIQVYRFSVKCFHVWNWFTSFLLDLQITCPKRLSVWLIIYLRIQFFILLKCFCCHSKEGFINICAVTSRSLIVTYASVLFTCLFTFLSHYLPFINAIRFITHQYDIVSSFCRAFLPEILDEFIYSLKTLSIRDVKHNYCALTSPEILSC